MRRFTKVLVIAVVAALALGGATAIAADQIRLRTQDCDPLGECTGDQVREQAQERVQLQDGSCENADMEQARTQTQAGVVAQSQQPVQTREQEAVQAKVRQRAQEAVQAQVRQREQVRDGDQTCEGALTQTQTKTQTQAPTQGQVPDGGYGDCSGDQEQDRVRDGSCGDGEGCQTQSRAGSGRCGA